MSIAVPMPSIHNEVLPRGSPRYNSPIIVLRISHDSLLHVQPTTELTAVLHNWFDCSVMERRRVGFDWMAEEAEGSLIPPLCDLTSLSFLDGHGSFT